jgi:hypothetical protein
MAGITVEAQQTTGEREILQYRPCMSASTKSGIQVGAARPVRSIRPVPARAVPACVPVPRRSPRRPATATAFRVRWADRSRCRARQPSSRRSFHRASSHNSNLTPCPINIASRVSKPNSRKFGGSNTRPCPSSSSSVACPTINRCRRRAWGFNDGQTHQFALDFFPIGQGIDEQALVLVHGDHQFAAATLLQPLPIPGRHDHPAFGIESQFVGAAKHV